MYNNHSSRPGYRPAADFCVNRKKEMTERMPRDEERACTAADVMLHWKDVIEERNG